MTSSVSLLRPSSSSLHLASISRSLFSCSRWQKNSGSKEVTVTGVTHVDDSTVETVLPLL